ncbi:MAG: acyltransferase [Lachnospiraceae bacterium]|nr:acyltransferase [Lachnospiraceae bacterium]
MEKKRQANFELLRIIAMMMVIVLHYIIKGNMSVSLSVDGSAENHLWWLIEGFCNVAVNVYVLISGYFLVDSKWHVNKLVKLVCQVLFYSIITGVIMYLLLQYVKPAFLLRAANMAGVDMSYGLTAWLYIFLPIEYEHYWFATAYVIMYMLSPVLAVAVRSLPQKQLKTVIIALLCFFCIPKSVNPYLIPTDNYGYDFGWFICLFLIAGYIRKYDLKLFDTKAKAMTYYVTSVLLNWGICSAAGAICRGTGKLEYYVDMTYAYNYIFVLFSSVAFFYVWKYVSIEDGLFSRIICAVAPLTFGVYLLHENIGLRLIWPYILGAHTSELFIVSLCRMILAVVAVFVIGCIVDYIRTVIFTLVERAFKKKNA